MESNEISSHLAQHFSLQGTLSPLAGELDLNYKLDTDQGDRFIVKVSRDPETIASIPFQEALLLHLKNSDFKGKIPAIIPNLKGSYKSAIDMNGVVCVLRVFQWMDGRLWAKTNPVLSDLRHGLGNHLGQITQNLQGFTHPFAHRNFEWDLSQCLWVTEHLHLFNASELALINPFINAFKTHQKAYNTLPKSVIHNDANDHNIIVSHALIHPQIIGLIDYGDACYSQTINDLAIACTYGIMDTENPLAACLPIIKGYHESNPLSEQELLHLFHLIGMRLVVSLTKAAMNKKEHPENKYLFISEKPAWKLLEKWSGVNAKLAYYAFRKACNYKAHPNLTKFEAWVKKQSISLSHLFPDQKKQDAIHLDLSVSSLWIENEAAFNDLTYFQYKIERLQEAHPNKIIAGGYLEPRPLYTSEDYDIASDQGPISRCVHLGVDFWLPSKTPVHALLDGTVVMALDRKGEKEYGGFVILEHCLGNDSFYTLYGHLDPASIAAHKVGDALKKDALIGKLGSKENNGNWAPHLHFQILLDLLDYKEDFPGVQTYQSQELWADLCPDPNQMFQLKSLKPQIKGALKDLLDYRKKHLGKSLSLQYREPIHIVRGHGAYLIDQNGQKYLDTVNNVAHVGHEHPRVVKAGQQQMAVLNTNTRYLHSNLNKAAKALIDTLPKGLEVVHFVNSGSEANELALRMAYTLTGSKEVIASEHGYHGNTNTTIGVSSYKFNGKGGQGQPENTHLIPMPDAFRGNYRGENTGSLYAQEVQKAIASIHEQGKTLGGFIIEPIISCGGQVPLPKDFLPLAYQAVRAAGGLCISDEVQTGCGRMGTHFWGFELYGVIPDIVTIGKPLGNGHPVAAVVCTQEVAQKFANGMEFFNTFGGNPVSCAIASETLSVIKEEKLQENAKQVGRYLIQALKDLQKDFPIIKDVRGHGLFVGIELLSDQQTPLAAEAKYLANRMKDLGILMSTDGPDHNVLKIKPPMVFSFEQAKRLLYSLRKVLKEDFLNVLKTS